ncbi:hypothetical protein SCHPADRAFT_941246 [Schizopora paradoxa]|uniref:CFEM domain-containing protein n=1 Tax=Schizopora paradoxa TaxID=27342 RepID=A0A0H2RSL9_9AGAM|nr:hypothetical protein SCHPADRAFT_941246 [Schizopora paradoxa]
MFVVLPLFLGANAQSSSLSANLPANLSSTATSSAANATVTPLSPCSDQCLTQAENSTTCLSFLDFECSCTNAAFQVAVESCLTSGCPDELIPARQRLANSCSALNITLVTLPAA